MALICSVFAGVAAVLAGTAGAPASQALLVGGFAFILQMQLALGLHDRLAGRPRL